MRPQSDAAQAAWRPERRRFAANRRYRRRYLSRGGLKSLQSASACSSLLFITAGVDAPRSEAGQGMQRTIDGPIHVARPTGSFFHAAIARLNFGLLGLMLGNGRPAG